MTVKSRKETRANREGTSKAGKGPLKHHAKNREGPGQKKREAQRASRAMRKHGIEVRKQGICRGGRRPPRPPSRREYERNQQDRGRAREESQQGWERITEAP